MTDILIPKKNVIMDATLLSSLMSCPRLHDLRYNNQLISLKGKSNSLEVGSLIHKVLEVFYKHIVDGFPRATAIAQGLTAGQLYITGCAFCASFEPTEESPIPACKHEPGEYPGLHNTPEENDGQKKTGWKWALKTCEEYFNFYKNDSWVPLQVEYVDKKLIYEDDELRVMWKAKYDLTVDTNQIGICSTDHKTFKQRRDKSSLSNQFMGHCVLLNSRNVIVNKIGLQTSLKIEERLTREIVSYSLDRLQEWQNEIVPYYAYKLLQYTESEYWPPNFTHCETIYGPCQFKDVCEANRNMRVEVLRTNFQKTTKWDPMNKDEE